MFSYQHTPGISKDVVKERMLSNGDPGNCSEDGNSMFDEITPLQELLPATMAVETAIPGYASERLTYKRKKRESPLSLVVQRRKVIDHLAIGEALIEKKTAGRRSTTPEAFQHVDRIPGSLGSKGKRLRVNLEEYCAWEETQDLLRAPPGAIPTVVNVEGHDFEEYKVIKCSSKWLVNSYMVDILSIYSFLEVGNYLGSRHSVSRVPFFDNLSKN